MTPHYCRSCGAPIRWALTVNGRRLPVDYDPDVEGSLELRGEFAVVVARHSKSGLYRPHFATCPDADEWRNR